MLNDAHLDYALPPLGDTTVRSRPKIAHRDAGVKSATRALEIMELFTDRRQALSVGEIADALEIPQSSSSVLLHAMKEAGFVDRDRKTRKYVPSIRSVFLGNWIHDKLFRHGSLLQALDALSNETGANTRLGLISGIHVRYAHLAWPEHQLRDMRLRPGMRMPICHDALGRVLLAGLGERETKGIVRHANADASDGVSPVAVGEFMAELAACRIAGFAECADLAQADDAVLAVRLPAPFGVPAAIGLGLDADRLAAERDNLLAALGRIVRDAWTAEPVPFRVAPDCGE